MPTILRGIVELDYDSNAHYLCDKDGNDAVSHLLQRYYGKKIDLVISVREHP